MKEAVMVMGGKRRALVAIALMVALMAVAGDGSAGLQPGTNTDLADSDASFRGEGADDRSGISVAVAGDVNGDGFDDVLIGARFNDEGGSDAGQVYLILGEASGWSMDTDLSQADAVEFVIFAMEGATVLLIFGFAAGQAFQAVSVNISFLSASTSGSDTGEIAGSGAGQVGSTGAGA